MADQLSLFAAAPAAAVTGLPAPVAVVVEAARSMAFSALVVRRQWGIGIGPKRRWVLDGDRCCALSALILARGGVAERGEKSPRHAAARLLGVGLGEVDSFIHGFDDTFGDRGPSLPWWEYGLLVAKELGI